MKLPHHMSTLRKAGAGGGVVRKELIWNQGPKHFTVYWLGILVLTYAWGETHEISDPGGQAVEELLF